MNIQKITQGYYNNNTVFGATYQTTTAQKMTKNLEKALQSNATKDFVKEINRLIKRKPTQLQHRRKLAELKKAFNTMPTERQNSKLNQVNKPYISNLRNSETSLAEDIKNNIELNEKQYYDYQKIIRPLIKRKPTQLQHRRKLAELKKAFNTMPTERQNSKLNQFNRPHTSNLRNSETSLSEDIKNNIETILNKKTDYKKVAESYIKRKPTPKQHEQKLKSLKKAFSSYNNDFQVEVNYNINYDQKPIKKSFFSKIKDNIQSVKNNIITKFYEFKLDRKYNKTKKTLNFENYSQNLNRKFIESDIRNEEWLAKQHKIKEKEYNKIFAKNTIFNKIKNTIKTKLQQLIAKKEEISKPTSAEITKSNTNIEETSKNKFLSISEYFKNLQQIAEVRKIQKINMQRFDSNHSYMH